MKVLGWTFLAALLVCLAAAAAIHDRSGWEALAPGEATVLMQAESLVHDRDLAYTRQDFDRFLLGWRRQASDLELSSGSDGERITFGSPLPYALWIAPFQGVWPRNGFAIANTVLLAWLSVLAAGALKRAGWGAAPWLVALLVFASVLFAEVFRTTGGLFLAVVTFAAFRQLVRGSEPSPGRSFQAGALLAVSLMTDLVLGSLLVGAFFLPVPGPARVKARTYLALGALAMVAALVTVQGLAGGGIPWQSARFTPQTGYPLVDFPAFEWPGRTARSMAVEAQMISAPLADFELRWWSGVDLLIGRHAGLVPYFAPLVLIALCGSLRGYRRALWLAAVASLLLGLVFRPFDLTGASGLANGLFLPVYGALWLTLDPRPRGKLAAWRLPLGVVASLGLSALFLNALWRDPAAPRIAGEGKRSYLASAADRLPFETTQWRAPAGPAVEQGDLTFRVLSGGLWDEARHGRFQHAGGRADLLVGSEHPLSGLRFEFDREVPGLAVQGCEARTAAEVGAREAPTDSIELELPRWRRHSVPWSDERLFLYRVSLDLPEGREAVSFRIAGQPAR